MSEPEKTQYPELENKLSRFYQQPSPEPGFACRLETRLVDESAGRHAAAAARRQGPFSSLRQRPFLVGGMAVLLTLIIVIAIIGPQKVLAEMQRLFGYLPGYGFVQSEQVRVLAAPVEVRQGDVTLRVDNVISDGRLTTVQFTVTGLKPDTADLPASSNDRIYLVLPDGTRWTENGTSVQTGMGKMQAVLEYPPLPAGVEQVTLVMSRLPNLPAGYAPENWAIPLVLTEASSVPVTQRTGTPPAVLVLPYAPQNASASEQGVTISVLQVAQGEKELGVQVQFTWKNPAWKRVFGALGTLKDENGQQLQWADTPGPNLTVGDKTTEGPGLFIRSYRFAVSPVPVKKYIFTFDQVWFDIDVDSSFTFDLGGSPQPGQKWEFENTPGMELNIAGIPVKILSAEYIGEVPGYFGQSPDGKQPTYEPVYRLSFLCQPDLPEGISMQSLFLAPLKWKNSSSQSGSNSEGLPDGNKIVYVDLPQKPDRTMALTVSGATLAVQGSWQIEWVPPRP